MNGSNTSWEPPKEPYDWRCLVCETSNAAGSLSCSRCGCPDRVDGRELRERQRQFKLGQPYDGTHRAKPRSRDPLRRLDGSNKLPLFDLIRYSFFVLASGYAAYASLLDGKAEVFLSRRSEGIWVDQFWALSFVVLGYALLMIHFVAHVIDHFDRRPNENLYKTITKWSIAVGFPCLIIGVILQGVQK